MEQDATNTSPLNTNNKLHKYSKLALRIAAWCAGIFVAVVIFILGFVSIYLTPERATELTNRFANEALDYGSLHVERVDVTAWKSFPYINIDIDGLELTSSRLADVECDSTLLPPAYSDSLVSFSKAHMGINVLKLPFLRISLHDICVDDLKVNAVQYFGAANFELTASDETSDEPLSLPKIFLDRFNLRNCKGITYFSADSTGTISANLQIADLSLNEKGGDNYQLDFNGDASLSTDGLALLNKFSIALNGGLHWDSDKPMRVALNDMKAHILDADFRTSLAVHATDSNQLILESLDLNAGPVALNSILAALPKEYSDMLASITTNLTASATAHLKEKFNLATDSFPSIDATLSVPDCQVATVNGNARLDHVALDASLSLDNQKPELSRAEISKFILEGPATKMSLTGNATDVMRNALIDINMTGSADLGQIMQLVAMPLEFTLKGVLEANASLKAHLSDLSGNTYQNIYLKGDAKLHSLAYDSPVDTMQVTIDNAHFAFGSETDKTLRIKADLDTLSASMPGLQLGVRDAKAGFGVSQSILTVTDTTTVTPMGFKIEAAKARLDQGGGAFILMRNPSCLATITRYNKEDKNPLIHFDVKVDNAGYRDETMLMVLRKGSFDFDAHMRTRTKADRDKVNSRLSKLREENPTLTTEELFALARKRAEINDSREYLDMSVDKGLKDMLVKWNMRGHVKAQSGGVFTPYFPIRNRISNFDLSFSLDSIILHSAKYDAGNSNIKANGVLSNLRSTLLGRRRQPLKLILNINSDSMDVNQLLKASTDGMAFAAMPTDMGDASLSNEYLDQLAEHAANDIIDTTLRAIVVPSNIDATINIRSNRVKYTDLMFNRLSGSLLMHDGTAEIRRLAARTNIGSAVFNASYAAPNLHEIKLGFDLVMKRIQVGKFLKVIPGLDSIMPLLESVDGIIDANVAATTEVDSAMNVVFPSLRAAMKLSGDSLVFLDAETFKKIGRMLMFKNKDHNVIDHMAVELIVENQQMQLFPFMFNVDRYKLGVLGYNDLDLNFRYHISVIKSPIPFKFGINIYGNPDKMHFRFGGAKFKDSTQYVSKQIVDTAQLNLRQQINTSLRRGTRAALRNELKIKERPAYDKKLNSLESEVLTAEDSVEMIKGGFIEAPAQPAPTEAPASVSSAPATTTDANSSSNPRVATKRRNSDAYIKEQ